MSSLRQIIQGINSLTGKTLITFHKNGDLDAVASSIALSALVKHSEVRCVDEVNSQARRVLKDLGMKIPPLTSISDYSNIIIVDSSEGERLGEWSERINSFKGVKVIIDHHSEGKRMKAGLLYVNPSRASCSEIIYSLYKLSGVKPSCSISLLLAGGIISDTNLPNSADSHSIECLAMLLHSSNTEFMELLKLVKGRESLEEKLKKLEAVRNARFLCEKDYVIAYSLSDSFELKCASALVDCGSDYAFVANNKRGVIFGVKSFSAKGNMGKIMIQAGKAMNGQGGGHESVGGVEGNPLLVQEAIDLCMRLARRNLSV